MKTNIANAGDYIYISEIKPYLKLERKTDKYETRLIYPHLSPLIEVQRKSEKHFNILRKIYQLLEL